MNDPHLFLNSRSIFLFLFSTLVCSLSSSSSPFQIYPIFPIISSSSTMILTFLCHINSHFNPALLSPYIYPLHPSFIHSNNSILFLSPPFFLVCYFTITTTSFFHIIDEYYRYYLEEVMRPLLWLITMR